MDRLSLKGVMLANVNPQENRGEDYGVGEYDEDYICPSNYFLPFVSLCLKSIRERKKKNE